MDGLQLPLFRFWAESGNPGGVGKVFQEAACGESAAGNGSHFTSAFRAGMIRPLSGGPPADDTFSRRLVPKPSGWESQKCRGVEQPGSSRGS